MTDANDSVIIVLIYYFSFSFPVIFSFSFVPVLSNLLTKTCWW